MKKVYTKATPQCGVMHRRCKQILGGKLTMRKRISAFVLAACIALLACGAVASASSHGLRYTWSVDVTPNTSSTEFASTTYDVSDGDNYYTLNCSACTCAGGTLKASCTNFSAASKTITSSGSWMLKYSTIPARDKLVNFSVKFTKTDTTNCRCLSNGKIYA